MNQAEANQLRLVQRRREQLLQQLQDSGPEHFDQGQWFSFDDVVPDGDDYLINSGALSDRFAESSVPVKTLLGINLVSCGTTACLAGHAAICYAHENPGAETHLAPDFIAEYYDIPRGWFDGTLDAVPDHPGHVVLDAEYIHEHIREWTAQLMGLSFLLQRDDLQLEQAFMSGDIE